MVEIRFTLDGTDYFIKDGMPLLGYRRYAPDRPWFRDTTRAMTALRKFRAQEEAEAVKAAAGQIPSAAGQIPSAAGTLPAIDAQAAWMEQNE